MDIRKPHLIEKLHMTAVNKITRVQNHEYKIFTRKDLWAWAGLRIYAIMLPSRWFSVAHYLQSDSSRAARLNYLVQSRLVYKYLLQCDIYKCPLHCDIYRVSSSVLH